MKNPFVLIFVPLVLFFIAASGCTSKNKYTGNLTAVPETLNFNGEDNRYAEKRIRVAISGNDRDFKVSAEEEWIDVKEDGASMLIGVARNNTGKERSGVVRVVSHMKKPVEITVHQGARNAKDYDFFLGRYSVSALIKWPSYDDPVLAEWDSEIIVADRSQNEYYIKNFGKEGFSLRARYDDGCLVIDLGERIDFSDCVSCRIMGGVIRRDYYVVDDAVSLTGCHDPDREVLWFPTFDPYRFIGIVDVKNDRRLTELYSNIVMKRKE